MSTFDNPFDLSRSLNRSGCSCGRHASQAEHTRDTEAQLHCVPVESEEKRYENDVASAVMRAMFPKETGRRTFLRSLGASTALASFSHFFPLKASTVFFSPSAQLVKKNLMVGFILLSTATPTI